MSNKEIIQQFYQSFKDGNATGMTECYHDKITFEDPAFGVLHGEDAKDMWHMLLSGEKAIIEFSNIEESGSTGAANWRAEYNFGPQKRKVINEVSANFEFKDGKIINHKDEFNMWKWSRQALGLPGLLLGWSLFMKSAIQKKTKGLLDDYQAKQK